MLNIFITLIHGSILLSTVIQSSHALRHNWSATNEWTVCSETCGSGYEYRIFVCHQNTLYATKESVSEIKCLNMTKPTEKRQCSLGSCPTAKRNSFVWVTGNWTQCSKLCGNLASKTREVSCYLKTLQGQLLLTRLSKCDSRLEPTRIISCSNYDCPPKFLTSKWGKCPNTGKCGKSTRRRQVKCVALLKDGKHKIISQANCYRLRIKPPTLWMFCTPDNDKSCVINNDQRSYDSLKVKIDKDESEFFQMRSTKRLRLVVGQNASLFTHTKLSILCPVEDFPNKLVKWSHGGAVYGYTAGAASRVRVNHRGILIITEFLLNDTGVWTCHAGLSTADITLRHELPSKGFHNWLKRHSNQNYGMFNEESKGAFIVPDSLMWMKSDWSKCSVSCGSEDDEVGYQVRNVACEKVEAKYYKIIDDKYCAGDKPESKRRCKTTKSCPVWRIEEERVEECTDQCISVALAKKNSNIYCEYETRTVDSSFCDPLTRPNMTCRNTECTLTYVYGTWSQCSLSCSNTTGISIQSRTMHCVWQNGGRSAYNLCQQHKLDHSPVTKSCAVPRCILGCRDLSPACGKQSKYRCRSSLFYHFCCAFCHRNNII